MLHLAEDAGGTPHKRPEWHPCLGRLTPAEIGVGERSRCFESVERSQQLLNAREAVRQLGIQHLLQVMRDRSVVTLHFWTLTPQFLREGCAVVQTCDKGTVGIFRPST